MTDEQIEHMVNRFLGWRLPDNFSPDCGIHFDADAAKKLNPRNLRFEPVGTNLFDAEQATAMVRYMLDGLPPSPPVTPDLRPSQAALDEIRRMEEALAVAALSARNLLVGLQPPRTESGEGGRP